MTNRYGPREAIVRFGNHPVEFLFQALRPINGEDTRYTSWILLILIGIFTVEVVFTYQTGAKSTYQLVSFFYKYHPEVVWPIAPLLHRGIGHFAANLAIIYILAPIEKHMTKREYGLLILLAGFLTLYIDGVKLYYLGSDPHVAVYGASGFGFGLLGYAFARQWVSIWKYRPRCWLIYVLGFIGIGVVFWNLLMALSNPVNLNFGHFGGLTIGLLLGYRAIKE